MNVEKLSVRDFVWLAAMGVGFVGLSGGAWWASARQDLWVCNGLPGPVRVQIDNDSPLTVPDGQRQSVNLAVGAHTVQVRTPEGKLLAQDHLVVPSHHDLVAYNVLGAMPLYAAAIVYKPEFGSDEKAPDPEFYGGKRLIARNHVNYLFAQPPEQISVSSKDTSKQVRWFVDTLKGGWPSSVRHAHSTGNDRAALELCQVVAGIAPKDEEAQECVVNQTAVAHGYEAARKAAVQALHELPRSLSLHRSYQGVMRILDRTPELRAEYKSLHTQSPQDAMLTALYGRTLAPDAAIPILKEGLNGEGEIVARRGLAVVAQAQGRFKESLVLFEQMAKTDPEYERFVEDRAQALLGLGRPAEALAMAVAYVNERKKTDWRGAVLVAEIVRSGDLKDVDGMQFVQALGKQDEDLGAYMHSYLGEAPVINAFRVGPHIQKVAAIQSTAARDPAAAWSACRDLEPGMLLQLAPVVALLLTAEFERVGDSDTAALLGRQVMALGVPLPALYAYAQDGTTHPELWRLHADALAALDLVHARTVEAEGDDAAPLYKALSKRTILNGVIARAIASWPHPVTPSKVITLRSAR